jgi:hypothetical protein
MRDRERERSTWRVFEGNKQESDRSRNVNGSRGPPTYFIACWPFFKPSTCPPLQSPQKSSTAVTFAAVRATRIPDTCQGS